MLRLQGEKVFLSTLEREDCRKLWEDTEADLANPTDYFIVGSSIEKADEWYGDIQSKQGKTHIRLGIFLPNEGGGATVIGDIALQDINWQDRSCTLGYGLSKIGYRSKGYTTDAAKTILRYGFCHFGLERISATTLEHNIGSQRVLEKCGFTLEGRERKAVYIAGRRYDRLIYGILADEFIKQHGTKILWTNS